MVSSSWKRTAVGLKLDVTIPVNSRAKVSVPKVGLPDVIVTEGSEVIWEDGSFHGGAEGIADGSESAASVILEIGSGSYSFELRGAPA
jgi:alpha-L-rhamnosidase